MDFKENDLFQENEQNEHISVKLQILRDFKREPYTVCSFFTENCLFLQNHQISMKLQISVLLSNFQKTAFYRSSLNEQNEQISSLNEQNAQISMKSKISKK